MILTVEPLAPIASLSGGAGDTATTIAFEGSGDGAQSGALSDARPETVARWVGSGLRTGRLTFTVRGPVSPQGGDAAAAVPAHRARSRRRAATSSSAGRPS